MRFGHEGNKCFKKNPLLKPRSSSETGETNLTKDLLFCDGSETALTSQKCEVRERISVIYSGAFSHMFFDCSMFFDFSKENQRKVKINANGTFTLFEGVGNVSPLLLDKDGIERRVTLSDCLFLPDHFHNLISVSKLRHNRAQVNFEQSLRSFVNGKATSF